MAELNDDGTWSDYIFANGKRIARSDSFDERIHIEGTSNTAGSYAAWYLPFSSYVIQPGDKISWRQYQNSAVGGIGISFTDGTNTNWATEDTDGQVMNSDNTESSWHFRTVDLSAFAGKTANNLWITADAGTPVGPWFSNFGDIAIYSTNGNVIPIYFRQTSTTLSYFSGGSESNTQAFVERDNAASGAESPWNTTTFYSADQVGSVRMLTAGGGWPVSSDTYYPFGQEVYPPATDDHYKFTGKERDSESGNDYFGARYYASSTARFMSPDWSATAEPVPYASLDDPQSLNLYAYVRNNPLSRTDPDGHWCLFDETISIPASCTDGDSQQQLQQSLDPAAQNAQNAVRGNKPAPQPAPTGADGKPAPPPVPVPGCADCKWVWSPDKQNPRKGRWVPDNYPKTPGGIPGASWDPGGHWDVDPGNGPRARYTPDGKPITPGEAHPPRSPMDSVGDWLNDQWQGVKQYLRDHPYGPNSHPGPYVLPLGPTIPPVFEF